MAYMLYRNSLTDWWRIVTAICWRQLLLVDNSFWLFWSMLNQSRSRQNLGWCQLFSIVFGRLLFRVRCIRNHSRHNMVDVSRCWSLIFVLWSDFVRRLGVYGIIVVVIWVDVSGLWHRLAFVHRAVVRVLVCGLEHKQIWSVFFLRSAIALN